MIYLGARCVLLRWRHQPYAALILFLVPLHGSSPPIRDECCDIPQNRAHVSTMGPIHITTRVLPLAERPSNLLVQGLEEVLERGSIVRLNEGFSGHTWHEVDVLQARDLLRG
jgi:hypothetical protein